MKRLLLILILFALVAQPCLAAINTFTQSVDHRKVVRDSYAWTGHAHKDKAWIWAKEVEDRLDGTTYNQSFYLQPTTAPTANEGRFYYDSTSNMLTVYNGSDWITLGTSAGGDSLDTAYNNGEGITVDSGTAVTLTTSVSSDSAALAIVHGETGAYPAFSISNAGTDPTIEITTGGAGADITGTSATWSISKTGAATLVGVATTGELTVTTSDVLFDDTFDVAWDTDRDQFIFQDDAILGIGGAHDAAADLTFSGDGTDVYVEVAAEDGADLVFGATNALDILIHNDQANALITYDQSEELLALNGWDLRIMDDDDIVFGDDVASDSFTVGFDESTDNLIMHATTASDKVQIGDGTTDTDFKLMTNTATTYVLWSAVADEMIFDYADLKINDQSQIEFADSGDATDWTIDCVTGELLLFTPTEITDDQVIHFGTVANTTDFVIFGENASDVEFDSSADEILTTDYHIRMGDDDLIRFGADGDFSITASSATQLDVNSLLDDETAAIDIGASASGIDVNWFELEAGDYVLFDASRGDVLFDDVNLVMKDDTRLSFGDSNDLYITSSSATQTDIVSLLTDETAAIDFGADQAGIDVNLFGTTASAVVLFDASGDKMIFDGYDLRMDDADVLIFGDDSDFTFTASSASQLDIGTLLTDEIVAIDFGASTAGVDVNLFAAAAGDFIRFDASTADLVVEDCNIHIMDATADSGVSTLIFGDSDDIIIQFDGTNGDLDITGAGLEIAFGEDDAGPDIYWYSDVTTAYVFFDEDTAEVNFADIDLSLDDQADLKFGDGDDFIIDCDIAARLDIQTTATDETPQVCFGYDQAGIDVNFAASATGDYIRWDASTSDLVVEDCNIHIMDAIAGGGVSTLIFGDGDDIEIQFDGTNGDLDITGDGLEIAFGATAAGLDVIWWEGITGDFIIFDESRGDVLFDDVNLVMMDDTRLQFGDSNDFYIINTGATQLGIVSLLTDETAAIDFGADTAGIDVNLFGTLTGDYVLFDSSVEDLIFEDVNILLMDTTELCFGDSDDFTITSSSATQLDIGSLLADETAAIDFGADQAGIDVNLFGTTASSVVLFDASSDKVIFDGYDARFNTGDYAIFGDTNDFTITASGTSQLDIGTLLADEIVAIDIGASAAGVDVNLFATTAGDFVRWDASAEDLIFDDVHIHLTDHTADSGTSMIILGDTDDATIWYDGTNADLEIVSAGDIILNPGSDGVDCSGDILTHYLKETTDDTDNETLTEAHSGGIFTNQGDTDTTIFTLPAAADGIILTFLDVEAADTRDLCILTAGDDTINGGVAGQYYNCYTNAVKQSVTIVAISAIEWIVVSEVGTWTNDDDTAE